MNKLKELQKQIDENYLIPINSLYQYIELKHLDSENEHKISQDEWDNFVSDYQDNFAEQCSLLAKDLFDDFINNRKD